MYKLKNNHRAAQSLIKAFEANPHLTPVLDLDGVLLDASHRIELKADGSLDLDKYRANTTAELVAQDKNLALMAFVEHLNANCKPYHVATARVACQHTRKLLRDRGIKPQVLMARDGDHDRRKDYRLKTAKLTAKFTPKQLSNMVLIDDCSDNCKAMSSIGVKAINIQYKPPTAANQERKLQELLSKL